MVNKITDNLFINEANGVAEITIVGDIGYNYWADTYEDYKKNTSENIAKELNAIKALKAEVINLTLESYGGDVAHALSIYSQLKNTGAKINTYYRGVNASASTIIGSVANKENITMDEVGLFLIHKPMNYVFGNENDMEQSLTDLKKWKQAIVTTYLNIGVSQEVIDDLMERANGHGEWLTFEEAKNYGFVNKSYETVRSVNYTKDFFTNKGMPIPKNINNLKNKIMAQEFELTENTKNTIWDWLKDKISNNQEPTNDLQADYDTLKTDYDTLKVENDTHVSEIETLQNQVADLQAQLDTKKEENIDEVVENKVKEIIKNSTKSTEEETKKSEPKEMTAYEKIVNKHTLSKIKL